MIFSVEIKRAMLQQIQILRAMAVLLATASHTFTSFGAEGVDLFFIISGFIMCLVIENNPRDWKIFLLNRFFRIAPLYYLFTFLFVMSDFEEVSSIHQIIQVITMLKYYETSPLLSIGWTLEYEFVFYLMCTLALIFISDFRTKIIFILLLLIFSFCIIDLVAFPEKKYGHFFEFLYGVIAYLFWRRNVFYISRPVAVTFFIVGVLGLYCSHFVFYTDGFTYLRFLGFGLPVLAIFISLVFDRQVIKCKVLEKIGDASYSIYISHTFLIYWIYRIGEFERGVSIFLDIMVWVLVIIFGYFCYRLVESPLLRFTKQKVSKLQKGIS